MLAQNAVQTLLPLAAFVFAYEGELFTKIVIGVSVFFVLLIVSSILRYWFFRFYIGEDSILIRDGVFNKTQLDIKFDRIQGINTQQNIIYRRLGLVTVTFDTAGSAGSEGNLPAVTTEFAAQLRKRIGKHVEVVGGDSEEGTADAPPLLRYETSDVIKIGLADRRALILLAFLGPLTEQIGERVEGFLTIYGEAITAKMLAFGAFGGSFLAIGVVVAILLVFALLSIAAAFLRYHNFHLFLERRTLRSHGGLLTHHETTLGIGKVQTMRLSQGILLRMFKRATMKARQATSGGQKAKDKNLAVPLVTLEFADEFLGRVMAPEAQSLTINPYSSRFARVSPRYIRSRLFMFGVLPSLGASTVFFPLAGPGSFVFLAWIPFCYLIVRQVWRRLGYLHDDDGFVRRTGFIGYRTVAYLFRKVQRVTVTQSLMQRRKNLATLRVQLASGGVRVPYLDYRSACQLRDYILYKVESSQQSWH